MDGKDYFEIQNLIHRYPLLLDSGDLDGVGQLFAHADVYMPGRAEPFRKDPAGVTKSYVDFLRLYEGKPRTRHMMANVIIEPDGPDRARGTCYVIVFQQTNELPLQPIIGGDYLDKFAKVGGVWRFIERTIRNDLFGNLSAHGKYAYRPSA